MTTASKMIEVAAKYIGTKGDYNKFNKWYWVDYTKTYSSDPGTAWCACFLSYVANEAKLKCGYSASAAGFATQFKRIPVEKENTVKKGDIVVFNWDGRTDTGWCDHVGIVEWSTIGDNDMFGTIEGNTGNAKEGQVLRVTRNNNAGYFTAFYRPSYSSETSVVKEAVNTVVQAVKSKLYGIDVSSNQPKNITKVVKNDFGIVKMSGNPQGYSWNYVNPYAKAQADYAKAKHGHVAFYHFTYGLVDPTKEADFFWEQLKKIGYSEGYPMVIDYEAQALGMGRDWVKRLAQRLQTLSGRKPIIYASGSVIVSQDLMSLGYPIWCANYSKGYDPVYGYSTSGMKIYSGCEKSILWQFTSQGYLDGYDGPLDMNVFFGSESAWVKLGGKIPGGDPNPPVTPTDDTGKRYRVVAKGTLNVRRRRSSKSKIMGTLKRGDFVYLTDLKTNKYGNTWGKITKGTYKGRFIAVKFDGNVLAERHYSVETIAKQVIQGKWGNGDERRKKLESHGYSYEAVQEKVNELLG